jgi:type IV secretory pathway VirB3-like protein
VAVATVVVLGMVVVVVIVVVVMLLDCAVARPMQRYKQLGHENKTRLKYHVAIHISRTICAYYGAALPRVC